MRWFLALDERLAQAERALLVAVCAALVLLMMAQVVLRYVFSAPLFWAEEAAVQLLVLMTLFGLALLVHQRQLITIDLLPAALPARLRDALAVLLAALMLALLCFVARLGWDWVARPDVRLEIGATLRLPRWINYSALPLAFSCMAWHQAAALLRALQQALRHTRGAPAQGRA